MSGPHAFARQMAAVDALLRAPTTMEGLEQAFFPALTADNFDPHADVKRFLAAAYGTAPGRAFLEWVADLTVRAPPGASGNTLESAAIAHAKHESRFAVGQSIFLAAQQGLDLLNQKKEPAK